MSIKAPLDIVRTARLRARTGSETVETYGFETRRRFAEARQLGKSATHVIIPVRNEEEDLPATLVALARNADVSPVVVTNNCDDATATRAAKMGAIVVDQPTGKKMAATQTGVRFLRAQGVDRMLATDGDTLAQPGWAARMTSELEAADEGYGAVAYGSVIVWHGASRGADALNTASRFAGVVRRRMQGQPPLAGGANYGLQFDRDGLMEQALFGLDGNLFAPGEGTPDDLAVQQALLSGTYAACVGVTALDSRVITRGDRYSFGDAFRAVILRQSHRDISTLSYAQQYAVDQPATAPAPPQVAA